MGKLEIFWQAETFLVKGTLTCVLECGRIKCQLICPMKYVVLYSHLILLTHKFWREPPQSEVSIRKGLQEAMVRHSTLLSSGGCNTCLNPSDRPRCCISAFIPWYLSYLFIPLDDLSRPQSAIAVKQQVECATHTWAHLSWEAALGVASLLAACQVDTLGVVTIFSSLALPNTVLLTASSTHMCQIQLWHLNFGWCGVRSYDMWTLGYAAGAMPSVKASHTSTLHQLGFYIVGTYLILKLSEI